MSLRLERMLSLLLFQACTNICSFNKTKSYGNVALKLNTKLSTGLNNGSAWRVEGPIVSRLQENKIMLMSLTMTAEAGNQGMCTRAEHSQNKAIPFVFLMSIYLPCFKGAKWSSLGHANSRMVCHDLPMPMFSRKRDP